MRVSRALWVMMSDARYIGPRRDPRSWSHMKNSHINILQYIIFFLKIHNELGIAQQPTQGTFCFYDYIIYVYTSYWFSMVLCQSFEKDAVRWKERLELNEELPFQGGARSKILYWNGNTAAESLFLPHLLVKVEGNDSRTVTWNFWVSPQNIGWYWMALVSMSCCCIPRPEWRSSWSAELPEPHWQNNLNIPHCTPERLPFCAPFKFSSYFLVSWFCFQLEPSCVAVASPNPVQHLCRHWDRGDLGVLGMVTGETSKHAAMSATGWREDGFD